MGVLGFGDEWVLGLAGGSAVEFEGSSGLGFGVRLRVAALQPEASTMHRRL